MLWFYKHISSFNSNILRRHYFKPQSQNIDKKSLPRCQKLQKKQIKLKTFIQIKWPFQINLTLSTNKSPRKKKQIKMKTFIQLKWPFQTNLTLNTKNDQEITKEKQIKLKTLYPTQVTISDKLNIKRQKSRRNYPKEKRPKSLIQVNWPFQKT